MASALPHSPAKRLARPARPSLRSHIESNSNSTPTTTNNFNNIHRNTLSPISASTPTNRTPVFPSHSLHHSRSAGMLSRKTSYNQLTQNSLAAIPDASHGYGLRQVKHSADVDVGDIVNAPGGLYGVVKFVGTVRGKGGIMFVGIELEDELAGKGKNDGAVEGVRYFTTARPMSGIFVPLSRASKRHSASSSQAPPTPTIPNLPTLIAPTMSPGRRSESPAPNSFSASIKTPSRPSLPSRPESPLRRLPTPGLGRPSLVPPVTPRPGSAMGTRIGALSPTPGMGRTSFGSRSRAASTTGERPGSALGLPRVPKTPTAGFGMSLKQPKSGMRPGSSMGMRPGSSMDRHDEEEEDAPRRLYGDSSPIDSGIGMGKGEDDEFSGRLKMQLAEKDRQLREQAASLIEMENSLTELQSFMATANSGGAGGQFDDADSAQLRSLLREKNDKIHVLTGEFDAHRADFRSTIDTLELASSETERVYERRVEDLLMEIRELQDRNEDVESVARQLKQLEELVAELEEGLEDARRGEAEARGEVEFLRGEVERSREELRREKEKSAAAVANAAVSKMRNGSSEEVEKKDDEIRGLKAIINSLSRDSVSLDDVSSQPAPSPAENLTVQISELQNQIMSKVNREEELEREIEELRKKKEARTSASSEKTVTPWANRASGGDQRGSGPAIGSWRNRQGVSSSGSSLRNITVDTKELSVSEEKEDAEFLTPIGSDVGSSSTAPWCEICEAAGHDILTCTNMFGTGAGGPASAGPNGSTTAVAAAEKEIQPEPKIHRQASSYSIAEGPSGCPPSASPAPPSEDSMAVSDLADKKKTVHLPYLTANVDINSPFGPVAGKDSGIVEADKWCALCERDGHDSVDCPLEMDY